MNETLGWQWPGSYPYAAMDTAFYAFMGCLKTLYIGVCTIVFFLFLFFLKRKTRHYKYCINTKAMQRKKETNKYLLILGSLVPQKAWGKIVNKYLPTMIVP